MAKTDTKASKTAVKKKNTTVKKSAKDDLCIIIPCFNEEKQVPIIAKALEDHIKNIDMNTSILFVDDGSTDTTWETVLEVKKSSKLNINGIRFSRNFGKDMAILSALRTIKSSHIIVIDVDGQHPPELIPQFVDKMKKTGADIVNGIKRPSEKSSFLYRIGATVFNKSMSVILGTDFYGACDFKLLNRRAIDALCTCGDKNFFFRGLTHWIGYKQENIRFQIPEIHDRSSRWTNLRLFRYAIDGIVLFSYAPLYFIFILGLLALGLTGVLLFILIGALYTGDSPPGYATLLTVCLLNLSFTMLSIGCLGMYVKNILDQAKDRPHYYIAEAT